MQSISYARHQFPAEIIRHAVWLYLRFTLSYRDVEELLAERGIETSYETVRRWVLKFGPMFARNLRRLSGIYIDCGWRDQYHIHYGTRQLSRRLAAARIPHHYEEFDDDHSDVDYRMDVSLPFLYRALQP